MGIDAMIYFKSDKKEPRFEWEDLTGATIEEIKEDGLDKCADATHRVQITGNNRYYGPGYERGVWPTICGILLDLFACRDITKVWYGGDVSDPPTIEPQDVVYLSLHYMKNGNRPYYDKWEKKETILQ